MNSESETCTVICRNIENNSHVTQTCHIGCSDKTADGLKPFIGDYKFRVDIMYGPINVCGIIKHRSERVKHIKGTSVASVNILRITTRVREKSFVFFRKFQLLYCSFFIHVTM